MVRGVGDVSHSRLVDWLVLKGEGPVIAGHALHRGRGMTKMDIVLSKAAGLDKEQGMGGQPL